MEINPGLGNKSQVHCVALQHRAHRAPRDGTNSRESRCRGTVARTWARLRCAARTRASARTRRHKPRTPSTAGTVCAYELFSTVQYKLQVLFKPQTKPDGKRNCSHEHSTVKWIAVKCARTARRRAGGRRRATRACRSRGSCGAPCTPSRVASAQWSRAPPRRRTRARRRPPRTASPLATRSRTHAAAPCAEPPASVCSCYCCSGSASLCCAAAAKFTSLQFRSAVLYGSLATYFALLHRLSITAAAIELPATLHLSSARLLLAWRIRYHWVGVLYNSTLCDCW